MRLSSTYVGAFEQSITDSKAQVIVHAALD